MFDKVFKWSDFFELTDKDIITYKITPDKTVSNTSTPSLARSFHELYNTPQDRIKIDIKGVKVTYIIKDKVHFDIVFKPGQAYFYISVPVRWAAFIKTKMENIWPRCAIQESSKNELIEFDINKCEVCDIKLSKANIFSLKTAHDNLYPLTSMMAVLNDMKGKDKVRVSYVFDSVNRIDWQDKAADDMKKFKKGVMPKRATVTRDDIFQGGINLINSMLQVYIEFKMLILESLFIFGSDEKKTNLDKYLEQKREYDIEVRKIDSLGGLSDNTTHKLSAATFKTYIRILSQSDDINRRVINMRTIANSFKDLNGDNELQLVELPVKKQRKRFQEILGFRPTIRTDKDIMSDEEISKLIQLPQITLQEEYKINSIDTREIELPEELLKGSIRIGSTSLKRKIFDTYWNDNYNIMSLPKVIVGPMGAGKTEYVCNYGVDASVNDNVIVFDYIKNCELSAKIESEVKDPVILDLSKDIYSISFPEVEIGETIFERLEAANLLSEQVRYLINSLVDETTQDMTSKMQRYLNAASQVVFINPGATLYDVYKVLSMPKVRREYINIAIESGCYKSDDLEVQDLESIDDITYDKKTGEIISIENADGKVERIFDRFNVLFRNLYLKQMMKAPADKNINFVELLDKGSTILIKMPESKFSSKQVKDTLVTYYLTRIWLAMLVRGGKYDKPKLTHVITDEVRQVKTASRLISDVIDEARKFGCSFVFTCHYFNQFRSLLESVKSSGVSYMLLGGTEKQNYMDLKEEIYPFTIEEAMQTKPFDSLNIINYNNQHIVFNSKLPPVLK